MLAHSDLMQKTYSSCMLKQGGVVQVTRNDIWCFLFHVPWLSLTKPEKLISIMEVLPLRNGLLDAYVTQRSLCAAFFKAVAAPCVFFGTRSPSLSANQRGSELGSRRRAARATSEV